MQLIPIPIWKYLKVKDWKFFISIDPLDEFVLTSVRKYKDYEFKSVDSVDLKNIDKLEVSDEKKEKAEELSKDDKKHFDSLISKMKDVLGDRVVEVKESQRLSGSPAILVNPDDSMSSSMHKILRMTNKEMGIQKKVFEINKDHKLIRNLLEVFKKNSKDDFINNVTEELFETALLLEGDLNDPHKLVTRTNKLLELSSELYIKKNS